MEQNENAKPAPTPPPASREDQIKPAIRPGKEGKIQHSSVQFGQKEEQAPAAPPRAASMEPEPVPIAEPTGPVSAPKQIRAFGKQKAHEEQWSREPNANGTGAIHVKTFHSKISEDALNYMDQQINEWLDEHPEFEVKFVNSTVGLFTGKTKEPSIICQVWV